MDDFFLYQSHAEGIPEPAAPPAPSAAPWATYNVDVPALIGAAAVVWVQYLAFTEVPAAEITSGWEGQDPAPVYEEEWVPQTETVFVPPVAAPPPEVSAAPWATESPDPVQEEEEQRHLEEATSWIWRDEIHYSGWNVQSLDPLWPTAPPPFEGDIVNPIVVEAAPEVSAAPWATESPNPIPQIGVVWVQYLALTEVPAPAPDVPESGAWTTQDPEPIPGPEYVPEGGTDLVIHEPPLDTYPAAWATQDPDPILGPEYVPEGGTDLVYAPPPLDPAAPWATQDPGPVIQTLIQWVQYLALVEVPAEEAEPETFGWLQQDPDPIFEPDPAPQGGTDITEALYVAPPAVVMGWEIQDPDPIPAPMLVGIQYLAMAEFEVVFPAPWATQSPDPLYLPEELYYEPQGGTDITEALYVPPVQTQSWEVQDPDPIAGDVYVPEGGTDIVLVPPPPFEQTGWNVQDPDPIPGAVYVPEGGTDFVYNPPPSDTTGIGAWCWQNPEPIPGPVYIPEGGTDIVPYEPPDTSGIGAWCYQNPDPIPEPWLDGSERWDPGETALLIVPPGELVTEMAITLRVMTQRRFNAGVITERAANMDVITERRYNADV